MYEENGMQWFKAAIRGHHRKNNKDWKDHAIPWHGMVTIGQIQEQLRNWVQLSDDQLLNAMANDKLGGHDGVPERNRFWIGWIRTKEGNEKGFKESDVCVFYTGDTAAYVWPPKKIRNWTMNSCTDKTFWGII